MTKKKSENSISMSEEMVQSIIDENAELRKQVAELSQNLANTLETLEYMKRKMFGTSSEKARPETEGQLDFFNEIEAECDPKAKEPELTEVVGGYARDKRKPKATREEILAALPIKKVLCELTENDRLCPLCDTPMEKIGEKFVREELMLIPAKVTRVHYYKDVYACPNCKDEHDEFVTQEAETPTPLLKHSLASPSTVAYSMYQKFVLEIPLYRQEANWLQEGVRLSRATLANWCNTCAELYFKPVYDRLRQYMIAREILHGDEVPCQVLKEPGRPATSKSYMWVYVTGNDPGPTIVLYDYSPGRKGAYAREFLKGFKGFIHCDGYQGYNSLDDITRIGCMAHMRRKFYDAIPLNRPVGGSKLPAEVGVQYCDSLFELERKFKGLSPDQRQLKRLEKELPIIREFWKWVDQLNPASGSKLDTAVTYAKNQRQNLEGYLLDGRLEISNNKAERECKAYVMSRKNFLFHDTVKGATASSMILSLIETAKANDLNIYQYLYTLLLYMPAYKNEPEGIEDMMPWSDYIQKTCAGPKKQDHEMRLQKLE